MSDVLIKLFPGISSLFLQEPVIAIARVLLIIAGFFIAYYGFKRTLEPLIMVPMGLGMIAVNAGVLIIGDGGFGTIFIDSLVEDPIDVLEFMQINWLQPIYNLTFGNGLIACLVFMGIGALSEIGFILSRPWTCVFIAILAELGTFVAFVIGIKMGLLPNEAAAVAVIGGADGPMVLFTSIVLARHLFVPIAIISYLYLSLTYAAYPFLVRWFVPKKYLEKDVEVDVPNVSKRAKFISTVCVCALLCWVLPVAAPLMVSFFLGVAIKEAGVEPLQEFFEGPLLYGSTLFLGFLLGTLCEAQALLDPRVASCVILGIIALGFSALGGLAAGWIVYWFNKGNFNPAIGIAGISCVPTTAKIAQDCVSAENPFAIIMPIAMGCNISGVIVSAVASGVLIASVHMVA